MDVRLLTVPSGRAGRSLPVTGGSWDWPLNGIPTIDVAADAGPWLAGTVPVPLQGRDGLLLTVDDTPWIAGPLTAPLNESGLLTAGTVQLRAAGIEQVLAGWLVLAATHTDGAALAASPDWVVTGDSWGTIAAQLVRDINARNGQLPIILGGVLEDGTRYVRSYEPWNLANNNLWARLQDLMELGEDSDVPGPDMSWRPEWTSPTAESVAWRMLWGTSTQATLPQDWRPVIDLTAPSGPVAAWQVTYGRTPATRIYGVGAGQGAGQLVAIADRPDLTGQGMVVAEAVMPDTSNDQADLLARRTAARAASMARPVTQLSVTVAADDERTRLGRWTPGQVAQVTIGDRHSLVVPGGTREWRCVRMHGDIGAGTYTVELQEV